MPNDMRDQIEEQIAHLVRDALAEEHVRPVDEVHHYVAEELGVRDPEVLHALRDLVDERVHGGGVRLLGDRVVEVTRFAEPVASTHRLSAAEVDGDWIDLNVDLGLVRTLAEVDGGLHRPEDAAPLHLERRIEFVPEWGGSPRVHHRLVGPAGWLDRHVDGELVVLRGYDGFLSVESAPEGSVESAAAVAERLRDHIIAALHDETAGDGSPIGADELVLTGLVDRWWPVDEVLPPLGELVEAVGLEVDGDQVGPAGGWGRFALLKRSIGLFMRHGNHLDDRATSAIAKIGKAFEDFCADPTAVPDGALATQLHRSRGEGAMCLHEELQRTDPTGEQLRSFVAAMPVPKGPAVVVGHMLESLGLELAGDPVGAEAAVEAAAAADPRWFPAMDARLSFLEARGDLRSVVNVMAVLREPNDPELVRLRERLHMLNPSVGRNEPCPCGSGRKFKQCHQGRVELPIEHRVGWLLERAANWMERFAELDVDAARTAVSRARVDNLGDVDDVLPAMSADIALFELGGLERFAAARRHLLPPDDVTLLDTWLAGERTSLYRVGGIGDDGTLTLVDLAPEGGGESLQVTRSQAFSSVSVHELVWCRLLPVGEDWVSSGVVMRTSLQRRAATLAALEARSAVPAATDGTVRRTAVAAYVRLLLGGDGTGGLLAGDGMPWVHGVATWHVGNDSAEITAVLDEAFGDGAVDGELDDVGGDDADGDGRRHGGWTSLDAEGTVLATFRLFGCIGPGICPGAAPDVDDAEVDDEYDMEAYAARRARIDAGLHGFDVTVFANSIPRLHTARAELQRLFPDAVQARMSVTSARRHHAFLRVDEVMQSLYQSGDDDEFDEFDEDLDVDFAFVDADAVDDLDDGELDVLGLDGIGGSADDDRLEEVLAQIPEEVRDQVLETFGRAYEERWLDMELPALGGRTPRQAAADPALRPDLLTLLAEFGPMGEEPGVMSTARIRTALGLDPA